MIKSVMNRLSELYGRSFILTMCAIVLFVLIICAIAFSFINAAAPTKLVIASGPVGSTFYKNAVKYRDILKKQGVVVTIRPSDGSADNLKMLTSKNSNVDVGFVQGGETDGLDIENLISLGSISYQPLFVFYRGENEKLLSDFKGKKISIGPNGSGTRTLALTLLKANGLGVNNTVLMDSEAKDAVKALLENRIDALFIMGDSASTDLIKGLVETPNIHIFNFTQADGYTRRIKYLNKLVLPQGALDLGKNIPTEDLYLIAPAVELVAKKGLHPALSDLLLEAAREVHGSAGMFRKSGEFPAPIEQEFRISPDATRYYTSGKSFLYRNFPFWLASLINRILAVLVPIVLLLVPAVKLAPALYRWRIHSLIYPWYKALLEIERDAFSHPADMEKKAALLNRLNQIEETVNKMKIPSSYGDLFYSLRGHISFVRNHLAADEAEA